MTGGRGGLTSRYFPVGLLGRVSEVGLRRSLAEPFGRVVAQMAHQLFRVLIDF